ncbi:Uu.00g123670.m01.CDS01 [Anthostomella pinea]|uniref:Uu.00g123670.m01.CDS01 n=1 Tax=Anthostomella pinea TaxID=933095 RepID=A0AAI8VHD4_9PEZI|nr:Uu.00g123670.m01.CDS01 [Anthostomella pinea]
MSSRFAGFLRAAYPAVLVGGYSWMITKDQQKFKSETLDALERHTNAHYSTDEILTMQEEIGVLSKNVNTLLRTTKPLVEGQNLAERKKGEIEIDVLSENVNTLFGITKQLVEAQNSAERKKGDGSKGQKMKMVQQKTDLKHVQRLEQLKVRRTGSGWFWA